MLLFILVFPLFSFPWELTTLYFKRVQLVSGKKCSLDCLAKNTIVAYGFRDLFFPEKVRYLSLQ